MPQGINNLESIRYTPRYKLPGKYKVYSKVGIKYLERVRYAPGWVEEWRNRNHGAQCPNCYQHQTTDVRSPIK